MFGCYEASGPGVGGDDGDQHGSWRDGILTRIFKQMDKLDNVKIQIDHPDMDSAQNAVS